MQVLKSCEQQPSSLLKGVIGADVGAWAVVGADVGAAIAAGTGADVGAAIAAGTGASTGAGTGFLGAFGSGLMMLTAGLQI